MLAESWRTLNAVPEPSTGGLLAMAAATCGGRCLSPATSPDALGGPMEGRCATPWWASRACCSCSLITRPSRQAPWPGLAQERTAGTRRTRFFGPAGTTRKRGLFL